MFLGFAINLFGQCGGGMTTGTGGFCTLNVSVTSNLANVASGTWNGTSIAPDKGGVPIGVVLPFTGGSAPTGYLIADGSAISRTTYADLFAVAGTTYGVGDGSTTFNLPDLRQRFPLGKASSGTGSTLGGTGGAIDHNHTVNPPNTTSGAPSGVSAQLVGVINVASATHTHDVDIAQFNSGTENPPFIVLNYIVKY